MSFDLNIRNYKTPELVKMFDLPENYDRAIIEIRETRMKENILNDREINETLKMKTIQFLVEAKNILLGELKPIFENTNAVITNMNELYNTSYELKPFIKFS